MNILVYGQGGLLDILFSKKNVWVSYSENMGNWKSTTSIAKGEYSEKKYILKIFLALNQQLNLVITLVQDY